jgi:hypothetical protein
MSFKQYFSLLSHSSMGEIMIVSQLDHRVFSMETLVQEFQDELGYSFEIKANEELEFIDSKLDDED